MVQQVSNSRVVGQTYTSQVVLRSPEELFGKAPARQTYSQDHLNGIGNSTAISDLTQYGVGAFSGYKYHQTVIGAGDTLGNALKTGGFSELVGAIKVSGKSVGVASANAAGIGAIMSGGVSTVVNGVAVLNGRQSFGSAVGNVATDSIKGAVSGIGGLAIGGVSAMALKAFGMAGTPVLIAGVVGGAVGATLANKLLKTERLRN